MNMESVNGVPVLTPYFEASPTNGVLTKAPNSDWAYDHNADPDAHQFGAGQGCVVGNYFIPVGWTPTAAAKALAANRLYAIPFYIERTMNFDRIATGVTISGGGGTLLRAGIYADGGTALVPTGGALVVDSGAIAADGVAVVQTVISISLTKGYYWACLVSNGTPTMNCNDMLYSQITGMAADLTTKVGSYYVAFNYAALEATFPAGSLVSNASSQWPCPFLRYLSAG